jgi:hypothetical protein
VVRPHPRRVGADGARRPREVRSLRRTDRAGRGLGRGSRRRVPGTAFGPGAASVQSCGAESAASFARLVAAVLAACLAGHGYTDRCRVMREARTPGCSGRGGTPNDAEARASVSLRYPSRRSANGVRPADRWPLCGASVPHFPRRLLAPPPIAIALRGGIGTTRCGRLAPRDRCRGSGAVCRRRQPTTAAPEPL